MSQFTHFVGVDIASASFTACAGTTPWKLVVQPVQFENSEDGYASFLDWMKEHNLRSEYTVVCMEATGVYYERFAHFLVENNCSVAVVLPNKIKNFTKSLESKSKTDPLDAAAITRFGLERQLKPWTPTTESLKALHNFCREYRALKSTITEIKNQRHALTS